MNLLHLSTFFAFVINIIDFYSLEKRNLWPRPNYLRDSGHGITVSFIVNRGVKQMRSRFVSLFYHYMYVYL